MYNMRIINLYIQNDSNEGYVTLEFKFHKN